MTPPLTILLLSAAHQARLQLVAEQRFRLAALLQEEFEELQELRSDFAAATTRRDRFFLACEARCIREDTDNRIDEVLTTAQRREWEEIRDDRRAELRAELQRHASGVPFPFSKEPFPPS
jgi:hypothetical protein